MFTSCDSNVNFSLPISFWMSLIKATIFFNFSWPVIMGVEHNVVRDFVARLNHDDLFRWSLERSCQVRLCALLNVPEDKSPSKRPTSTPAIGPSHGISEMERANPGPNHAADFGELSMSLSSTVITTETSLAHVLRGKGADGRSTQRGRKDGLLRADHA